MHRSYRPAAAAALLLVLAGPVLADPSISILTGDESALRLSTMTFPGGKTVTFNHGIGSGAFRHPADPPNVMVTVGDRGPNFLCSEVKEVTGLDARALCGDAKGARVYPVPDYSPSIYVVALNGDGTFAVRQTITLKDSRGTPVNGLLNPLTVASTEAAIDGAGRKLSPNPDAVDAEGIVKLADGSYWIGEENAPSLLHVAPDGRIRTRVVPRGSGKDFAGAHYEIVEGLPAILAKRATNRGIESLAISPDERFLYTILQNPLANPDSKAYAAAKNTRILKIERATLKPVAEYVYQLDDPMSFRLDPSDKQNAPRISELTALGADRLLVLERTEATTKIYEIALAAATDILGSTWDDAATRPTLEQSNDLGPTGIAAVTKTLRFDSADFMGVPGKVEGIALMGDGTVALINDSDFGIVGATTKIVVLKGSLIRVD